LIHWEHFLFAGGVGLARTTHKKEESALMLRAQSVGNIKSLK
jgi:hypothetical protein